MNDQNIIPHQFTTEQSREKAVENGRKGGVASGESKREKAQLRELMLAELQKDGGNGLTKAQYLVAKTLDNHARGKLTFKDLKDLQDILGESVQNFNLQSDKPLIIVASEDEAEKLRNIKDLG